MRIYEWNKATLLEWEIASAIAIKFLLPFSILAQLPRNDVLMSMSWSKMTEGKSCSGTIFLLSFLTPLF